MQHRLHFAILALLTLIWGTTWAAIRIGLEGLPPFTGAALRFAVAALALLAVARWQRLPLGRTRAERWLWLASGLLNFAISYGIVYWAEQYLPSGLTALLFAAFPLFVAVLAHFFLPGERLGALGFCGTALGFGGVALLFGDDLAISGEPKALLAASVMLLAPLSSAIAQILVKRFGQGIHPFSLTAMPMAVCAPVLAVMAWGFERDLPRVLDAKAISSVLYLALVGASLAFSLYFYLLQRMTASSVALVAYTAPVVAVAVGVVMFDEPLTAHLLFGALAVVAGVALTSWSTARRPLQLIHAASRQALCRTANVS